MCCISLYFSTSNSYPDYTSFSCLFQHFGYSNAKRQVHLIVCSQFISKFHAANLYLWFTLCLTLVFWQQSLIASFKGMMGLHMMSNFTIVATILYYWGFSLSLSQYYNSLKTLHLLDDFFSLSFLDNFFIVPYSCEILAIFQLSRCWF